MGRVCDALYTSSLTAIVYVYLKAFVQDEPFGELFFFLVRGWGEREAEQCYCMRVSWDVYVTLFTPRLWRTCVGGFAEDKLLSYSKGKRRGGGEGRGELSYMTTSRRLCDAVCTWRMRGEYTWRFPQGVQSKVHVTLLYADLAER